MEAFVSHGSVSAVSSSELVRISGSDDSTCPALVCLPAAGGGAASFNRWRSKFPPQIRVYAARLPGRESMVRAEPLTHFDAVVDSVSGACRAAAFRTVSLFGHCLGALIAHAVAEQLEADGVEVVTVGVASQASPDRVKGSPPPSHADEALWRYVAALGGTRPEVLADPDLRSLLEPMLLADFGLTSSYDCRRRRGIRANLVAFIGESDDLVTEDDVRSWSVFTDGAFEVRRVPGGHFFSPEGWDTISELVAASVR